MNKQDDDFLTKMLLREEILQEVCTNYNYVKFFFFNPTIYA